MLYFFCLLVDCDHRDLHALTHSFPTRRSSDVSTRVTPVTFFQRSATARCTAMPPPSVRRRCEKSIFSKPGVLSRPLNSVLTPVIAVNGTFDNSLTKPGRSEEPRVRKGWVRQVSSGWSPYLYKKNNTNTK